MNMAKPPPFGTLQRSDSNLSDGFDVLRFDLEDDPNDILNMEVPSPSRRSHNPPPKPHLPSPFVEARPAPPPPPGGPGGQKKKPRADWSSYRNENGYFVCPFSPSRTFHNTSNLSKHCDKKHNGFRPPPRQRQDTKRRRRRAAANSGGEFEAPPTPEPEGEEHHEDDGTEDMDESGGFAVPPELSERQMPQNAALPSSPASPAAASPHHLHAHHAHPQVHPHARAIHQHVHLQQHPFQPRVKPDPESASPRASPGGGRPDLLAQFDPFDKANNRAPMEMHEELPTPLDKTTAAPSFSQSLRGGGTRHHFVGAVESVPAEGHFGMPPPIGITALHMASGTTGLPPHPHHHHHHHPGFAAHSQGHGATMPSPSWNQQLPKGSSGRSGHFGMLHKTSSGRSATSFGIFDSSNTEKWMMEVDDLDTYVEEVAEMTAESPHSSKPPAIGDLRRPGSSFHRRARHGGSGGSVGGSAGSFMMLFDSGRGGDCGSEASDASGQMRSKFFAFNR